MSQKFVRLSQYLIHDNAQYLIQIWKLRQIMQTTRSSTFHLKRHPTPSVNKACSKPAPNKIFSLIDSLYLQLKSSPPSPNQLQYFKAKIDEYRIKLSKLEPSKKSKKYNMQLEQCQRIVDTERFDMHIRSSSRATESESEPLSSPLQHPSAVQSVCNSSKFNSVQMELLRSTVQSKECLLKQLYEKEKSRVKNYQEVIKQQQIEMQLVRNRLNQVEVQKSKEKIKHKQYSLEKLSKTRQAKNSMRHEQQIQESVKMSHNMSQNKQNMDSNMSRTSNRSVLKEIILRGSQQSSSFEKTERTSRGSKIENPKSNTSYPSHSNESSIMKQQEQLIVYLQNQNRILSTTNQTLEISILNKEKTIKSKQKLLESAHSQIKQLKQQLRVKQQILTELIYQKQNYSDAYLKLKQESQGLRQKIEQNEEMMLIQDSFERKFQDQKQQMDEQIKAKQQQIVELEQIVIKLNQDLEEEKERNEGLMITLQKQQDKFRKLTTKYNDCEQQNKQVKLKLRTMQHKMEMYMEKYYKLQNENIISSKQRSESRREIPRDSRSFDRSQKLFTNHTYQISCDREMETHKGKEKQTYRLTERQRERERDIEREGERQRYTERERQVSRKKQVLSQIKNMVRDRRNHLFE